jgi:transmembrane sensor
MTDPGRFATAGEWLLRLQDDDLAPEEFAAWLQWYEADPLNRAAFEDVQSAFESAHGLHASERDDWARRLIDSAREPVGISPRATWGKPRAMWLAMAVSVAAISAGIVAWQAWLDYEQPPALTTTLQTPRATHRLEKLPDGSTVRLGARSSISLSYTREARHVVLESGEAFFAVAKDSARPFVVQAGSIAVYAIGTEFNVRRDGESTIVTVREGKVEVVRGASNASAPHGVQQPSANAVRLGPGEQAAARDPDAGVAIRNVSPQAIAAWQEGRLEFADEPLRQVIATVNRYSSREIVITDQSLAALRITGTVAEDRVDEWMRALPAIFPLRVVEVSRETVLLSPAENR